MSSLTASEAHRTIDAVWRIESARLLGGLVRMVRDVGLAEDLAQEALVAALERWPASGIPDTPGAWLMASARNRAIDELRRRKMVERAVFGDLHQPGAWVARHAFGRPLLERRDQRVVREVLGEADVADHADESGDQAGRFDAPDRVDCLMRVRARHASIVTSARPARQDGCRPLLNRPAANRPVPQTNKPKLFVGV